MPNVNAKMFVASNGTVDASQCTYQLSSQFLTLRHGNVGPMVTYEARQGMGHQDQNSMSLVSVQAVESMLQSLGEGTHHPSTFLR